MKSFFPKLIFPLLFLWVSVFFPATDAFSKTQEVVFAGRTMGTTYHIKAEIPESINAKRLQEEIDACLEEINAQMSTFRPDSEISRFNQMPAGTLTISNQFYAVMEASQRLYKITGGAWDGTIYPVLRLWGFFSKGKSPDVPSEKEIAQALQKVGFNNILLGENNQLTKKKKGVKVDLASIAKGYGVDQLLLLLKKNGVTNGFVEVGGEVAACGKRSDGMPWQIGVNFPDSNRASRTVFKTIPLQDKAIATSGTYENYFEKDGKKYSHVIDPRTGKPVSNRVVSVSVIAPTCMEADGLATALTVMGVKEGMAMIRSLPNVSCLILVEEAKGKLKAYGTASFPK